MHGLIIHSSQLSPSDPMKKYCKILDKWAADVQDVTFASSTALVLLTSTSQLIKMRRQDPELHNRNDILSRYMCMDGGKFMPFPLSFHSTLKGSSGHKITATLT